MMHEPWNLRRLLSVLLTFFILLISVSNVDARVFNVVNNCSYPVWFGFVGGANAPVPTNNNYQLNPGASNQAVLPGGTWSGVVAGRTNCNANGCQTGDCGGGTGACTHGFNPPATQAEFTLNANGNDYYDVEVINGINIPISVAPSISAQANNPYVCGAPGASNPSPGLGGCSWNFAPPLVEFNWVTAGGNACSTASDCAGGTICGLSFNPGQQQLLKKTCGTLLGYWTADQICGVQPNYGAPFNCNQQLPIPQAGHTWWDLFACVNVGSCYSAGADNTCCGCINWDSLGIAVPSSPMTQQCNNVNPNWKSGVQPYLEWLKRACPSAYTYPYDDPSSSYNCPASADYTITFCPSGSNPPPKKCLPPANIHASYTADLKSVTLTWQQPANSDPINSYQVNNGQNQKIWTGNSLNFIDTSLPGTKGTFTYTLYSNCPSGQSIGVQEKVVINGPPPVNPCFSPANVVATPSADKRSVTLTWSEPAGSIPITYYQVRTCENRILWTGSALQYVDKTLPGSSGKFSYYLYTLCGSVKSLPTVVNVNTLKR